MKKPHPPTCASRGDGTAGRVTRRGARCLTRRGAECLTRRGAEARRTARRETRRQRQPIDAEGAGALRGRGVRRMDLAAGTSKPLMLWMERSGARALGARAREQSSAPSASSALSASICWALPSAHELPSATARRAAKVPFLPTLPRCTVRIRRTALRSAPGSRSWATERDRRRPARPNWGER